MAFSSLNKTEKETVHQCLKVILNESYIDDREFSTRLGFDRESLKQVLSLWRQLDDSEDGLIRLAINNCMNEVFVYWRPINSMHSEGVLREARPSASNHKPNN